MNEISGVLVTKQLIHSLFKTVKVTEELVYVGLANAHFGFHVICVPVMKC